MSARTIDGLDELRALEGQHLGTSDWIEVTQERVDQFAEATGDHQWIHTDPERAAAGPFGGTIAHGFLTLSLLPALLATTYRIDGVSMGINYGCDSVRFPTAVPVPARVRALVDLTEVAPVDEHGRTRVTTTVTVELENSDKPACVATMKAVYVP
ncbi:MaoC family dehydratase [Kytococcus sedentarius]|uniref:MaoC family dehydratase n=1 Tax=Kytococcus sedentarius TaxID=1276 RepID=UPI0035BBD0CB